MKRKQTIRWILMSAGVLAFLFAVLVVHIYMVTSKPVANSNLVLSRIDFQDDLSLEEQNHLKSRINSLPGVYKAYVNGESKTIVYGYYREQQTPEAVLASLQSTTDYRLQNFEVSKDDGMKGCPAFDESSFTFKVGSFIKNTIH